MKELRNEVTRLKSDFEQKWSSQIKMVIKKPLVFFRTNKITFQVDANNRSVFKMHDKMVMLTEWLRSLGTFDYHQTKYINHFSRQIIEDKYIAKWN